MLFGTSSPPAAQGTPQACRGAPEGLPRAASGRPKPGREPRAWPRARQDCPELAQGRPRPAEELRKACPGPRQSAQRLAGSSPEPGKACPRPLQACRGALEGLPRAAHGLPRGSSARELPGSFAPGQPAVATRRLQQVAAQLCDIRQCRKSVRTCSSPLSTSMPNVSSRGGVAKRN